MYDCGLTGRAQNRTVAWDRAGPCLAMRRGSRQAGRDGNRASIFAVRGVWTANNYGMKSIIRSHPMTTVYVMQIGGYAGCWGSRFVAETVSSSRGWLSSNGCTAALRPSRVDNIIPRGRPSRTTLRCGVGDVTMGLPRDKGFVMSAHSASTLLELGEPMFCAVCRPCSRARVTTTQGHSPMDFGYSPFRYLRCGCGGASNASCRCRTLKLDEATSDFPGLR